MASHYVCVSPIIDKMTLAQKGMLSGMLSFGKDFQKAHGFGTDELERMGQDAESQKLSQELNDVFTEGLGIADSIRNLSDNYGKQLDFAIKKVLVKALKIANPAFVSDADTTQGAYEREAWITERLLESMIENMDEQTRQEMARSIESYLLAKGFDPLEATRISAQFLIGGITPLNALLATRLFGPSLSILILRLFKLSFSQFLWMSVFLKTFFAGPIGWGLTVISFLPMVTSMINKREYDKFLLGVFLIGTARLSQQAE